MPYDKISDAPPQWQSLAPKRGGKDKIDLTLAQINEIARMYDVLKDEGQVENPAAVAITNFRKMYKIEDGKWVKRKETEEMENALDEILADADTQKAADDKEKMAETYELNNFPFFKTGKHNGRNFTENDLDRIVTNFYSLKQMVKVVLKLGHGGQKFLKNEGLPAIGWIESIKKKAGILYADIKNIPKRIYQLLKDKAYQRPSAEIYLDFEDDKGQKYGLTLSAIALLGADIPAVKDLPDIEALFNNETVNSLITCYNQNYDRNKGGLIMPEEVIVNPTENNEELDRLKAELAEKESELQAKTDELDAKAAQVAQLEEQSAERDKKQREETIKAKLAKYKEEGKILPVQEPTLSTLVLSFTDDKVLFADNGDSAEVSRTDLLFKVLDTMPNIIQFEELSQQREDSKNDKKNQYQEKFSDEQVNDIELAELADKIMAEQKVSYSEALVLASDQLE